MNEKEVICELRLMLELDAAVTQDTRLDDLSQWDSMAILNVMALADEKFLVGIAPKQISACRTLGDIARLLCSS